MAYTLLDETVAMLKNRPRSLKTEEISKATGVTASNINKIESGSNSNPKFNTLTAIHSYLDSKGIKKDA